MFKNKDSKKARNLRYALCVINALAILMLELPFMGMYTENDFLSYTGVELMFQLDINNPEFAAISMVSLLFLIVPFVGLLTALFDRWGIVKVIFNFVSSFTGIFLMLFAVTPYYMATGSILSLLLYIIALFVTAALTLTKMTERRKNTEIRRLSDRNL